MAAPNTYKHSNYSSPTINLHCEIRTSGYLIFIVGVGFGEQKCGGDKKCATHWFSHKSFCCAETHVCLTSNLTRASSTAMEQTQRISCRGWSNGCRTNAHLVIEPDHPARLAASCCCIMLQTRMYSSKCCPW